MITAYHSGPKEILKFDFSNGVHFGGLKSSFEAALRKNPETIHTYFVQIKNVPYYETEDVGGQDSWQKEIEFAKSLGYLLIKYHNKYEPDIHLSYLVLSEDLIIVLDYTKHSPDMAEEYLQTEFNL